MAGAGKARAFRLVAPVVREHPLQKQIADALRIEIAPAGKVSRLGVVWFSVDHANYAGEVPGIRIGRGIAAGIPDMFVLYQGRAYLIELKAAGGVLSEAQKAFLAAGLCSAVHVGVAGSVEDVLALLDAWEVPRARRVK